jgi:hypothetical protein
MLTLTLGLRPTMPPAGRLGTIITRDPLPEMGSQGVEVEL